MARLLPALVLLISVLASCRAKEPPAKPKRPAPSAAPSSGARVPAPGIAAERVTALVERWRLAQEGSDFDGYAALYGSGFRGVKRVGNHVARFDRAGWLKDRRPMFQRDMKVGVSELRVVSGERSAFATFVQDWSTASFRDVGRKRLDFALRGAELVIVGEEMQTSTAIAPASAKPPSPEELALVYRVPGGFKAVIQRGPVPTVGGVRRVPMSKERNDYFLEKDVTEAALRPFDRFRGRQLDLYGPNGIACTGVVTSLHALGGFMISDPDEPNDEVWETLGDRRDLVAAVAPSDPACEALWARASDLPKPTVFAPRQLSAAESTLAAQALRKTQTSVAAQSAYTSFRSEMLDGDATKPAPVRWEELEGKESHEEAFTHPGTGATYVVAELMTGNGCEGFGASALGFFKVASPAWLDLTGDGNPGNSQPEQPLFGVAPLSVVELAPGAHPIMIGHYVVYAEGGAGYIPLLTIGRVRTFCHC